MKSRNALLFIAFLIVGLLPSSVSASTPENLHVPRLYRGTIDYPVNWPFFPPDEPFPDYPPQPFIGAYMDTNGITLGGVKKTRVTVSFPDTDPSSIQADNWLAGGMFVFGYDTDRDQIDYGYYTMLTLEHDGTLHLDLGINETYECLGSLLPPSGFPEGTLPYTKGLYNNTMTLEGVSPSTPITLTTSWEGSDPSYVKWEYTVDGITHPAGDTLNATDFPPTINPSFTVGSRDVPLSWLEERFIHWIPYEQTYRFQSGIISRYNIGQGGWNVLLSNPSYYEDDEWHNVETAKSIGGQNAMLDYRYMWGGEDYEGVSAYYYPTREPRNVKFYYSGARKDQSQSDLFENSHASRDYVLVSILVHTPPANLKIALKKVQLDAKVTYGYTGYYNITYRKGDGAETNLREQSFTNSEYFTYKHSCNVSGDYGEKITVKFYTKMQGPHDSEAVSSKNYYMHYDVFSPYGEWILDHTVFWGIPVAPTNRSETHTYSPPPEYAHAEVNENNAEYRLEVGPSQNWQLDSYAKATLFKDFVPKHTITNPTFNFRFHAKGFAETYSSDPSSYTYLNASLRLWYNENVLFRLDQTVQNVSEEQKEINFRYEIFKTYWGELLEGETYTIEYGFSVLEHQAYANFFAGDYRIKASWIIKADNYKLTVRTYDLEENEKFNVDVWIDSTHYSSPKEDLIVACGDHLVEVDPVFYRGDYKYTFQYWEDGDTSNPRIVDVINDMTLIACYEKTYQGGGGGGDGPPKMMPYGGPKRIN